MLFFWDVTPQATQDDVEKASEYPTDHRRPIQQGGASSRFDVAHAANDQPLYTFEPSHTLGGLNAVLTLRADLTSPARKLLVVCCLSRAYILRTHLRPGNPVEIQTATASMFANAFIGILFSVQHAASHSFRAIP
jgi:hypothetical protein